MIASNVLGEELASRKRQGTAVASIHRDA